MKNYIENNKLIIITTFIFGFIAHGFCYTNLNLSHDSLCFDQTIVSLESGYAFYAKIGRFIQPIYFTLLGNITMPFLKGFLQITYLAVLNICLCKILSIKNDYSKILLIGVTTTNYSISLINATYFQLSDVYAFSYMLATIGAYEYKKNSHFLIPVLLCACSLGIYQASLNIIISIFVIDFLNKILSENIRNVDLFNIFINEAIVILVSALVYFSVYKLLNITIFKEISQNYNDASNIIDFTAIKSIIESIKKVYKYFASIFNGECTYNYKLSKFINLGLLLLFFLESIHNLFIKKIKYINILVYFLIIIFTPLLFNFVGFLFNEEIEDIMVYGSFFYLILYISLLDKMFLNKKIKNILVGFISILLINNIIFSNTIYVKKEINDDATLSAFTRLVYDIEKTENYSAGVTPVTFVGNINMSKLTHDNEIFKDCNGTGLNMNFDQTYYDTYIWYINNYLSNPMKIVSLETQAELRKLDEVIDMPGYPSEGSIKVINGIVVVKLIDGE